MGGLLVTVATVILVAYHLLEKNLRTRLENFGINTVIAREVIAPTDPECVPNTSRPTQFESLQAYGTKVTFRQLYGMAEAGWQKNITALSYPDDALLELAALLHPTTPLILFNDSLPKDSLVEITLHNQPASAVVRRVPPLLKPLISQTTLLVPQGWSPEAEAAGFVETTVFQRETQSLAIPRLIDSIRALYAFESRTPPQIQSSIGILEELESLQARQMQWRSAMAGLLGLAVALVFGAIAVLEFRQNAYISALLRSFGTPSKALYIRQWLENAFLANLAALSAIVILAAFHTQIFGMLGFPSDLLSLNTANPYLSIEILLVLICVNVGAFLSSLSVAIGLRKPVGEILS